MAVSKIYRKHLAKSMGRGRGRGAVTGGHALVHVTGSETGAQEMAAGSQASEG